jgi:predicted naringenin-chalcone synthase
MTTAWINRIATAVPAHDIHAPFIAFARTLLADEKRRGVFDRMAERAGIAHRFSVLRAGNLAAGEVDDAGFYRRGAFPGTAARMRRYSQEAVNLAARAIRALELLDFTDITHLIVASCTGFMAPGLDCLLAETFGMRADLDRTMIGFMGCSAAIPALRAAAQTVRADPCARVLVVNLELCTLHLQESSDLESVLSFLLFGDGCSAALVSAQPGGIALHDFRSVLIPASQSLITWEVGDQGFLMHLSGQVPARIAHALRVERETPQAGGILRGAPVGEVDLWAVHGGGRTVLDAVAAGLDLASRHLLPSRTILERFGNMSSATVMFVLERMLRGCPGQTGQRGMAMAFGPGMVAETFRFTLGA